MVANWTSFLASIQAGVLYLRLDIAISWVAQITAARLTFWGMPLGLNYAITYNALPIKPFTLRSQKVHCVRCSTRNDLPVKLSRCFYVQLKTHTAA